MTVLSARDLAAAVPPLTGRHRLRGLNGPVDVIRDRWGIPHIRSGSLLDGFFAQGYVHAQDRLWQMEYDRRRAMGRWAELAGPSGLEQDVFARKVRIADSARADYAAASAETRAMLDAYTAGVNAFISAAPTLPVEYRVVGTGPEPWEPWQCGAVFKIRHILMGTFHFKLWRLRVFKSLGPEWIDLLRVGSDDDHPLIAVPGVDYRDVPDGTEDSALFREVVAGLGDLEGGSNNWTVHGSRTASGMPLLAGDPHRAIDVPNVYYQNHLTCPDFDAIGYSFCGVPGFPHFGHTAHTAWGVTHAAADYQDLYVERFPAGDPARYEYRGALVAADVRTERILVRGASPVTIQSVVTRNGPVILGDPATGKAISLRYTAVSELNRSFECLVPMLRARNVDELEESMREWVDPGNNFVMADTSGNIGYVTRGKVPVRPRENGWLPVPGWTGEFDWTGHVPFESMPRVRNPDQGFVATANQRIVPRSFPHYLSLDWSTPYRGNRVNARLRPLKAATPADMAGVHADKHSIPSQAFRELAAEVTPACPRCVGARELLLAWDGDMQPHSAAAAIYAVWREQVSQQLLASPALGPLVAGAARFEPLPAQALGLASRLRNTVYGLLKRRDTRLLPGGQTWATFGATALKAAVDQLTDRLGPDMSAWRWDAIHRTGSRHPLSKAMPELGTMLDPPTVGVGGDGDTPQNGTYACADGRDFTITASSVTRYCFDPSNWENSGWVVPLGASGHPGSVHYADQVEPWSRQELLPMLFSWDRVEQHAEARMRLEPMPGDSP
ncbi:MAG: penicillin acylase family protein [Chloroflexota bacterium]